jgi:hypothetical protein
MQDCYSVLLVLVPTVYLSIVGCLLIGAAQVLLQQAVLLRRQVVCVVMSATVAAMQLIVWDLQTPTFPSADVQLTGPVSCLDIQFQATCTSPSKKRPFICSWQLHRHLVDVQRGCTAVCLMFMYSGWL